MQDGPPVSLAVRVFDSDMGRVRLAAVLPKGVETNVGQSQGVFDTEP